MSTAKTPNTLASITAAQLEANDLFTVWDVNAPTAAKLKNITSQELIRRNVNHVNTIADLKALTITSVNAPILVLGYYSINDGAGGLFYWDSRSHASGNPNNLPVPNDGTVVAPAATSTGSSGAWRRYLSSEEPINLKWFGAKGDAYYWNGTSYFADQGLSIAAADDSTAFNKAVQAALSISHKLYVPSGRYYIPTSQGWQEDYLELEGEHREQVVLYINQQEFHLGDANLQPRYTATVNPSFSEQTSAVKSLRVFEPFLAEWDLNSFDVFQDGVNPTTLINQWVALRTGSKVEGVAKITNAYAFNYSGQDGIKITAEIIKGAADTFRLNNVRSNYLAPHLYSSLTYSVTDNGTSQTINVSSGSLTTLHNFIAAAGDDSLYYDVYIVAPDNERGGRAHPSLNIQDAKNNIFVIEKTFGLLTANQELEVYIPKYFYADIQPEAGTHILPVTDHTKFPANTWVSIELGSDPDNATYSDVSMVAKVLSSQSGQITLSEPVPSKPYPLALYNKNLIRNITSHAPSWRPGSKVSNLTIARHLGSLEADIRNLVVYTSKDLAINNSQITELGLVAINCHNVNLDKVVIERSNPARLNNLMLQISEGTNWSIEDSQLLGRTGTDTTISNTPLVLNSCNAINFSRCTLTGGNNSSASGRVLSPTIETKGANRQVGFKDCKIRVGRGGLNHYNSSSELYYENLTILPQSKLDATGLFTQSYMEPTVFGSVFYAPASNQSGLINKRTYRTKTISLRAETAFWDPVFISSPVALSQSLETNVIMGRTRFLPIRWDWEFVLAHGGSSSVNFPYRLLSLQLIGGNYNNGTFRNYIDLVDSTGAERFIASLAIYGDTTGDPLLRRYTTRIDPKWYEAPYDPVGEYVSEEPGGPQSSLTLANLGRITITQIPTAVAAKQAFAERLRDIVLTLHYWDFSP